LHPSSEKPISKFALHRYSAARNLSYQEHTSAPGEVNKLLGFKGTALMGCAVKSPLAVLEKIYCLPMMTILMNKGTGVVTSVPSDSPDDFMVGTDPKCHAQDAGEIAQNTAKVPKITCSDAGKSAQNDAKVPKLHRPVATPWRSAT
jgi:hypothetical protein